MAWKLDTIDFNTFGVYVSKSSGVLDLPKLVNSGTDWLGENGKSYWNEPEDLKYSDREIILGCWIHGTSFSNFKTKVAAFYSALMAPGLRTLTTPYNEIENITVQNGISLVRETSYVSSINAGTFTLRLNVAGDSLTKLITIYNGIDEVRGVYAYRSDAKLSRRLQGDDSITFDLEFNTKDTIGRDDYILNNNFKYIAFEYPEIKKLSTNKFVYSCTFQNEFFRLKDVQFRKFEQSEFNWWANLDEIIDTLIDNMDRQFPDIFIKGDIETTIRKNWQFTNESCFDVLTRLASDYVLEYGYSLSYGKIPISVKKTIGITNVTELAYGKGNGMYQISRTSTARDLIVTHLYAYGSNKNIPSGYRSGKTRLEFTGNPLVKPYFATKREVTKVWDDIFPDVTEVATGYAFTASPDPTNKPELAEYKLVDTSMPFDLNELEIDGITTKYMFSGVTPKIHFNTGSLAGFEFSVIKYDHSVKTFWLTPIKEVNDTMYPNATIYPASGDEFVLLDIKLPLDSPYILAAETALEVKAQEWIDNYYQPHTNYSVVIEPGFSIDVNPGDRISITDEDFVTETLRVADIQVNLYTGQYTISLSDVIRLNNRQLIEKKIKDLEKVVLTPSPIPIDIKPEIIDPIDEKFRVDNLVRDESIDPRMLAYDAGILQFFLRGAVVTTNVDDNEDKILVDGGEISITNYRNNTLARDEIKNTVDYDPTRAWNVPLTNFTLLTKEQHFIYAKLNLTDGSTDSTIVFSPDHKEVKSEDGYLMYKLGFITAGEE